jgi:DNA-binding MarR family transcriptional regulator
MSTMQTFGPQLIGQTEKALNAILDRELDGTGVTEPQWVTLVLAVMGGGEAERGQFVARVAGGLHISDHAAEALIGHLAARGLLDASHSGGHITVTDAGRALHTRVRGSVSGITERLWGDVPGEDRAVAARVLTTVLDGATRELARG